MRGKRWWVDGLFFAAKKMPQFSTLFLGCLIWTWQGRPVGGRLGDLH
jgi:hypothetical protein